MAREERTLEGWPHEGTHVTHQWPAGKLQIRWSDVVILAWEEVPHG